MCVRPSRAHLATCRICPTSGCACTLELCAVCGGPGPKWCFSIHYGTCSASCAVTAQDQMGPMSASGDGECPICMDTKPLYKLQVCGHEVLAATSTATSMRVFGAAFADKRTWPGQARHVDGDSDDFVTIRPARRRTYSSNFDENHGRSEAPRLTVTRTRARRDFRA